MKDIEGSSSETERPILPKNAIHKNLLQDKFSFSRASPTLRYGLNVNNDANFSFFFLAIAILIAQNCQKNHLVISRQR